MKKCTKCGIEKSLSEFSFKSKKLKKYASECKKCHKIMRKKYYDKNRRTEVDRIKKRKKEIAEWLADFKSKSCCEVCGQDHPATLHFHHKDSNEKDFNIGYGPAFGYSIETIIKEIKKCSILCANCHSIEHYNQKIKAEVD